MSTPQPVTTDTRHETASIVVIDLDTEQVLLVDHKATGKLLFPGGHVDQGEGHAEAAVREIWEETGLQVELVDAAPWMVADFPAPAKPDRGPGKPAEPPHTHVDSLFLAVAVSGQRITTAPDEVDGAGWYDIARLGSFRVREEVPAVAVRALEAVRARR